MHPYSRHRLQQDADFRRQLQFLVPVLTTRVAPAAAAEQESRGKTRRVAGIHTAVLGQRSQIQADHIAQKMLEKLNVEEIQASSRRYPESSSPAAREPGNKILEVKGLSASIDGEVLFNDVNFQIEKGDKGGLSRAATACDDRLLRNHQRPPQTRCRTYEWGQTITTAYLPLDNSEFFNTDYNLVDWLLTVQRRFQRNLSQGLPRKNAFLRRGCVEKRQCSPAARKIRCMIARMMLRDANTMIPWTPPPTTSTLESIQAFNNTPRPSRATFLWPATTTSSSRRCATA